MLGGADNPNGELLSYIIGADTGRGFRDDFRPGDSGLLAIGFSDGGQVSDESVTDDASSRRFLAVFSRFSSSDSRFSACRI